MKKTMAQIYKEFEENQRKLNAEYKSQSMNEEQIKAMYDFDKQQLARDIAYLRRTQELNISNDGCDLESKNPLLKKFSENLSVKMDMSMATRFWWIDEIEDPILLKKLMQLSKEDLELLTLFAIEGYKQVEISKIYKVNQSIISRKIARIKKFLS